MHAPNPLNPEAGYVDVPEDPREVEAALRAGRVTLRLFPYYGWRYGERGRAFTRSDSAWLAWLAGQPQDRVDQQVRWLRHVLASRGMPGRLLEVHLRGLVRQLVRAVPADAERYGRLAVAADGLAAERRQVLAEDAADGVAESLAADAGFPGARLLVGAGRLVADAVADEGLGSERAVGSLLDWLADVPSLQAAPGLRDALPAPLAAALGGPAAATWPALVDGAVAAARAAAVSPARPA
jgi:hypothetical protein